MVDSNTLSGAIQGGSLAVPGTAQLQVQNSQTGQASQSVPVSIVSSGTNVALPLGISATSLASGVVGTFYNAGLAATGGAAAYTWAVTSGNLPTGLNLVAASGAISGTPTVSGTFSFTVSVSDSSSPVQTQTAAVSITIAPAPLVPAQLAISTLSLFPGTDGTAYSQTLAAVGGTPNYSWSIASGSLPAGLALAAGTGVISGTPTALGTSTFTVTVSDSGSPVQTKSATLSITIASTQLAIFTSSLASGTAGTAYSQSLAATGGTPGYKWSITSGSLPAGLTLASGTGAISGTPTASGTSTFTVSVADSSNPAQTKSTSLSITVQSTPLLISTSSLASGTAGTAYSQTLTASGGAPGYKWSIAAGSLPAGLTLAAGTGVISGTPAAGGTSNFTVSVSDSSNPVQTKAVSLSITIGSPLVISTSSLASGATGTAYSQKLGASGGTPNYTWSIGSGSLPAGLTLAGGTGVISGTPNASGTSSFTVSVSDTSSPVQTKSASLSITVASKSLSILTSSLASGINGTSYSATLQASGGTPGYTWSITSGSLPAGLTLATGTGVISGTPTASGTSTFTVSMSDSSNPAQTKSTSLSITIANPPLSVITSWLPNGTEGTEYAQTLAASGGTPNYTWSISSGGLPAGMTLTPASGEVSGTPTTSGTFTFTVTVSDSGSPVQTKSASFTLTVGASTSSTGPGTTWYIRPDGGTRFDANQPNGQCNGKYDAPYPGTGVDQNCAFNDFRFLWDDQSYGNDAWVIAGGDTVVIEGCASNANQISPSSPNCRVGWDSNTGVAAGSTWCYYNPNAPYGCYNPTIPSGTPTQPTRILGANYASCSTGNTTNRSALTQIFGGFGVQYVLNLAGAVNVEVECLEITEHNEAVPGTQGTCVKYGSPAYPAGCNSENPGMSDYDENGIVTDNKTSNVLLQDVYIHGHTTSGIQGPIGGALTMNRVFIGFNGFAGWNFDDGKDTPDATGSSINANYVTMEGNGCNEQYPIVNSAFPAESCYDLNSGGFGDSWSGQDTTLNSFTCNHCVQIYNTKDGFIGPHTLMNTLLIENSESIGNMGQEWKWGTNPGAATTTFINNLTIGNCNRMSEQIPGAAQSFAESSGNPGAYLSLFCRAAGAVFSFDSVPNSTTLFAFNTVIAYSATIFDQNCPASGTCGGTSYQYKNNIFLGYLNDDPSYEGVNNSDQLPGLYYISDSADTMSASNNVEFGIRNGDTCGENNILCTNPQLVDEPANPMMSENVLDNFNFYPSATSPAVAAGVLITTPIAITADYYGVARPNPPSEGAVEPEQ